MASTSVTQDIVALLREALSSAEIAQRLDVSPPVVWGVKSHWRLGKYGDAVAGDQPMLNKASTDDIALLKMLAEGIDPFTGEVLPSEHLLQHPQIVRALFHTQHAIACQGNKSQRSPSLPANAGTAWSKAEDKDLTQEFDAKTPIPEIAQKHGRTEGAITSRLLRLGKISLKE
jgi:hypothetical protein